MKKGLRRKRRPPPTGAESVARDSLMKKGLRPVSYALNRHALTVARDSLMKKGLRLVLVMAIAEHWSREIP